MGREVVEQLLKAVRERLALLEQYNTPAFAGWERDPVRVAAAEHFLQVAIQAVIDICAHMTSERGLNGDATDATVVRRWADVFASPPDLAQALAKMVGFRNVLVHEYGDVNVSQLALVVSSHLGDFHRFIAHVLQTEMFRSTDKKHNA